MKHEKYALFVLALIYLFPKHSECFEWTRNQQTSRVINAQLGSDVSLPCEFLLTSDEESAMQQFHLIYWTRETPAGSQSWQGIAVRTNLINNAKPMIIHRSKSRYAMSNNSLTILSVELLDEGLYQCEVKSSFYTTRTVINLKTTIPRRPYDRQTSPLSNEASAGIGVGVTLIVIALIAVVAVRCLINKKGKQVASKPTNVENMSRDDAAEAHVGPGFEFPETSTMSDEAVGNENVRRKSVCTTNF